MSEPCQTCGHSLDTHDSGESQDGCRFQFGWGTECDCGWPVATKTTKQPQPQVGGEGVRAHLQSTDAEIQAALGDRRPLATPPAWTLIKGPDACYPYGLWEPNTTSLSLLDALAAGEARAAALHREIEELREKARLYDNLIVAMRKWMGFQA